MIAVRKRDHWSRLYREAMGLFAQLCRNTGLMIHGIIQPLREERAKQAQRREVSRRVEEENLSPTVTLRRTTIEEVEVRRDAQNVDRDG